MEIKQNAIGGATLWARQTVESEVFCDKPDKWFKIWFYLINKVCFKDEKRFDRGEIFLKYDWIGTATKATKNQIDSFIRWAKEEGMIETKKSTRGMILKITNYPHYQTLDNYYYKEKPNKNDEHRESKPRAVRVADTETETETTIKPNKQAVKNKKEKTKTDTETDLKPTQNRNITDTILKNDKNEKNDNKTLRAEPAEPKVLTEKQTQQLKLNEEVAQVFDIFYKTINPEINFGNKTSRSACEFLLKKYGLEKVQQITNYAIKIQQEDRFAPTITTPYQLKEKMSALAMRRHREINGNVGGKGKEIIGL